ncbi:MAG: NADH-quinone oxidoreductase subunit C [Nitrospinaceae bacterium]
MTSQDLVDKIDLGEALQKAEVVLGDAVLHVPPDALHGLAEHLKNDPDLDFNYLADITGVDYLEMDRELRFEAVYQLHSLTWKHSVRIRVGLGEDQPEVPTVSDLWKGAAFPERELFDMFGIIVTGHPKLQRLIMPQDWDGHPLRKDYPLVWEDIAFSFNPDHKAELIKIKPELQKEDQ